MSCVRVSEGGFKVGCPFGMYSRSLRVVSVPEGSGNPELFYSTETCRRTARCWGWQHRRYGMLAAVNDDSLNALRYAVLTRSVRM